MTTLRPMTALDLLNFNTCNVDPLTETYDTSFYLTYISKWPEMCLAIEGRSGAIEGYILGKLEESPPHFPKDHTHYLPWHAHITALTVSPGRRKLGLGKELTRALEMAADQADAWFVDLFVRESNVVAIGMYKRMGYSIFRRVVNYYQDDPTGKKDGEDAFDMRKPLKRDTKKKHVREKGDAFHVRPEDVW